MAYLLVYVGLLWCGLVSYARPAARRFLYGVCLVGLFFFVGFRYEVGCDWSGYENIFEQQRFATIEDALMQREPAFWLANAFLHFYGLTYPYINVIASAAFFLGLHTLARRQPDRLSLLILSFPVLIINLAMSGIRQAIAVGLLCVAYNAFVDKRLVRYTLFVLSAASFHASALSFLTLAPLMRGRLSAKRLALAGLFVAPGAYYLLTGETFQIYSYLYVGSTIDAGGAPYRTGILTLTGLAYLFFLNKKWKRYYPMDHKFIVIFSCLMLIAFPLSLFSSVIGDRFGYYLNPAQLMVLARLPFLITGRLLIPIALVPFVTGGLILYVWTQFSDLFALCYLPYKIW